MLTISYQHHDTAGVMEGRGSYCVQVTMYPTMKAVTRGIFWLSQVSLMAMDSQIRVPSMRTEIKCGSERG
jgi:hypothetical protein